MYNPNEDGVTHINIYSKGRTPLGQALSNFAPLSFSHPTYGTFASMEGFWYWLRTCLLNVQWTDAQRNRIIMLQSSTGYQAKELGREILAAVPEAAWANFPEEQFRDEIIVALDCKLQSHPDVREQLIDCPLPLAHYYVYGDGNKAIVREAGPDWLVSALEGLRTNYRVKYAQAFVARTTTTKSKGSPDTTIHTYVCSGNHAAEAIYGYYLVASLLRENPETDWNEVMQDMVLREILNDRENCFKQALEAANDPYGFLVDVMLGYRVGERVIAEIVDVRIVTENGCDVTSFFENRRRLSSRPMMYRSVSRRSERSPYCA